MRRCVATRPRRLQAYEPSRFDAAEAFTSMRLRHMSKVTTEWPKALPFAPYMSMVLQSIDRVCRLNEVRSFKFRSADEAAATAHNMPKWHRDAAFLVANGSRLDADLQKALRTEEPTLQLFSPPFRVYLKQLIDEALVRHRALECARWAS